MENFKQIAEDCLAGKLSGTFVLRCGLTITSKCFRRYNVTKYPYTFTCCTDTYTNCGTVFDDNRESKYDIIDFIPDMKKEQITIDIPEGKVPVMEQTENGVVITWENPKLTYNQVYQSIYRDDKAISSVSNTVINSTNTGFLAKVNVLRKLINIRNYFGGDKPTNSWVITIDSALRPFVIKNPKSYRETCFIYFDTQEHAQAAVDMLGDELKYLFEPW